jgi:hypothetical protein
MVAILTAAVGFQGLTYAGFHPYVQDVAPEDAGLVLAITNTCGTLVGIVGNVLTGWLAATPLGYSAVFKLTIAFQVGSLIVWRAAADGRHLQLAT